MFTLENYFPPQAPVQDDSQQRYLKGELAKVSKSINLLNQGVGGANGTALDNLTGFSGIGYLQRTGAGAYSFTPAGLSANNLVQLTGAGLLPAVDGTLLLNTAPGWDNMFRNGGFDIAHRGPSGTVAAGTNAYTLDGWLVAPTGAACAWSAAPYASTMSGNALTLNAATGMTACTVSQRIESTSAVKLIASSGGSQAVTIQFQIYNGTSQAFTPQIATDAPTAVDNFASVTSDLAPTNLSVCPAGVITTVSYTYLLDISGYVAYAGLQVRLLLGNALNAASGSIQISWADIRPTLNWPTGIPATPPRPDIRPAGIENLHCRRYLWQIGGAGAGGAVSGTGGASSTTAGSFAVMFPVGMRAPPTLFISAATDFQVLNFATNTVVPCTAVTLGTVDSQVAQINITTASGLTAGSALQLQAANANTRLRFSSEL